MTDEPASAGRFAGFSLARPLVMGIVNVTPDSFSDGGDRLDPGAAITAGLEQMAAGADLVDVGGESTRPNADPVTPEEEQARVLPVVRGLARQGVAVSLDSRHASTMAVALDAGARLINDVTALTGDPASLALVAKRRVPVILMHMQGSPQTMQQAPAYADVVGEVAGYLKARAEACLAAGVRGADICLDPGIGFGKTQAHNLALLAGTQRLVALGYPLLVGVSRKSFIGRLAGGVEPKARFPGSLAAGLAALAGGAHILRVHDVAKTCQALAVWNAIVEGGEG
ncbi:MAG: dihydropteroate synthase [Pseudomonadota bacterium]